MGTFSWLSPCVVASRQLRQRNLFETFRPMRQAAAGIRATIPLPIISVPMYMMV
jgi:hypothetical protein